jgi:hypothetical protein
MGPVLTKFAEKCQHKIWRARAPFWPTAEEEMQYMHGTGVRCSSNAHSPLPHVQPALPQQHTPCAEYTFCICNSAAAVISRGTIVPAPAAPSRNLSSDDHTACKWQFWCNFSSGVRFQLWRNPASRRGQLQYNYPSALAHCASAVAAPLISRRTIIPALSPHDHIALHKLVQFQLW